MTLVKFWHQLLDTKMRTLKSIFSGAVNVSFYSFVPIFSWNKIYQLFPGPDNRIINEISEAFVSFRIQSTFSCECDLQALQPGLFLSAAKGQRPRNDFRSCCCSPCSPFGSFPHLNETKFFLTNLGIKPLSFNTPHHYSINWATVEQMNTCCRPRTSIGRLAC